jgi:hypothetical protein
MEGHTNIYEYCESDGRDFGILICRKRDDSSLYFGSLLHMDQSSGAFSLKHFPEETTEEEIIQKSEEFIRRNLFASYMKVGPRQPGQIPHGMKQRE